jgi:hypothetical protein
MQVVFIVCALFGSAYFCLVKRRFDFFSLAFFSAIIYFLPGFFGYVLDRDREFITERIYISILDETYLVMILVLIGILLGAVYYDTCFKPPQNFKTKLIGSKYIPLIIVAVAVFGFIMTYLTTGDSLFQPRKLDLKEDLNQWHLVWARGAALGLVVSFSQKQFRLFWICLALLLFDFYAGFRSSFAMAILALFTLWMFDKGKRIFFGKNLVFKYWKQTVFFLMGCASLFIYKKLFITVKSQKWDVVIDKITDSDLYIRAFAQSEPFTTQLILNEVVKRNFTVDVKYIFNGIFAELVPMVSGIVDHPSFNDLFQPVLFPFRRGGVANNIWAQMWSSGGWLLLIIFLIIFVLGLALASNLLHNQQPTIRAGVALFFTYWGFYFHRNDVSTEVSLLKQIFLLWIFAILMAALIPFKSKKTKLKLR